MCDYSLHHVATRPAQIEDKLVTTEFNNSITRGFAAVGKTHVAVCLLPGTEITFDKNVECEPSFGIGNRAAACALPSDQHGQRGDPSRCVGISGRAAGAAHAPLRGPACNRVAIAGRCTSCATKEAAGPKACEPAL
jgi:hypothetical protein